MVSFCLIRIAFRDCIVIVLSWLIPYFYYFLFLLISFNLSINWTHLKPRHHPQTMICVVLVDKKKIGNLFVVKLWVPGCTLVELEMLSAAFSKFSTT